MKKRIAVLLSVLLVSGLTACGNQSGQSGASAAAGEESAVQESVGETPDAQPELAESDGAAAVEAAAAEGRTLVVYYSASGHTEAVAEYIAAAADAVLFELEPAEPYTDADLDWTDEDSRVVYEHDNPDDRAVELTTVTVPDWEAYDTVFIGYPIWWGIAAWPVDGFVEANDFTGKTVIPFCTSSSSDLGESGELLAEMAGSGEWLEGMRFGSSASQEDVTDWVESLGL